MTDLYNKSRTRINILEDDLWYSQFLYYHFSLNPDHEVQVFNSIEAFLKSLPEKPDIITLDYHLLGSSGEMVLNEILEISPKSYILAVSGQDNISQAINLIKRGVYDYIVKNSETKERLWNIVEKIKQQISLKQEIEELRREVKRKYSLGKSIVGTSPAMQHVFELVEGAAASHINILISGEPGTGKNVMAKAIHLHSRRAAKPFVSLNLQDCSEELLEQELFGYEEGVSAEIQKLQAIKLKEASGGTLFLNQVEQLSQKHQLKLLRLLQEKNLFRSGAGKQVSLDVRLITGTNQNLPDLIRQGTFREELYLQLIGIPIQLPPLRERGPDIPLLANKILRNFCQLHELPLKTFSPDSLKKLLQHSFPNNIPELKNVVELAAIVSGTEVINPEDIHLPITNTPIVLDEKTLDEYTADIVQKSLEKHNYNVIDVANKLKIGKSTIYRMIRKKEVVVRRIKSIIKTPTK